MSDASSTFLRRLILRTVLVTLVAGLAAAAFSMRLPNTYRARTLLLLAQMRFEQHDMVPGMLSAVDTPARRVNYLEVEQMEALAMPDYKLLLTSEAVVVRLRERLRALYQEAGIDPGNLTHEKVLRSMDVRTKLLMQTAEEIEYQQVVEMYLTAMEPKIAAQLANEWAHIAVEESLRMRTLAREGAVEYIQEQLDRVRGKLDAALGGIAQIDREYNPEGLAARLAGLEATKTRFMVRLTELTSSMARLEAESAALTAQAAQSDGVSASTLQREAALRAAELAGQRAEYAAANDQSAALDAAITQLREQVTSARRARAMFEVEVAALEKQADEFQVTLEATALAAGDMQPEFKIASEAIAPEEKTGPQRSLMVMVAIFLAAIGTPIHFFGMFALRRYVRSLETE
jgi:uncharacterized protein involved in exopolysaccharide biosynthesis